jgi:hypothetical protein
MIQPGLCKIEGFVKITDPTTGKVLVDKKNAIHYENISIAMAETLSNRTVAQGGGFIYEMAFGNGGSAVDPTGVITYLPPNVTGQNADLYNQTYAKVVDDNSATNTDPANNKMEVLHTTGKVYTDILVTCLLDYGEPAGQQAFDNSTNFNGEYVFDELGLKCVSGSTSNLRLITQLNSINIQLFSLSTYKIKSLPN